MQSGKPNRHLSFPPFCLDLVNECLWREEQPISLRRTPFAVLRYLLEHPGRLVTKEELLQAVWPDTVVSEAVLKGYIQQIRKLLSNDSRAPQLIETVYGRGYRWIAETSGWRLVPLPSKSQVSSL